PKSPPAPLSPSSPVSAFLKPLETTSPRSKAPLTSTSKVVDLPLAVAPTYHSQTLIKRKKTAYEMQTAIKYLTNIERNPNSSRTLLARSPEAHIPNNRRVM